MPYKHEELNLRVPADHDRRRKMTDEQKEDARGLRNQGWSQRQLARHFGVSRRLIQFVLDPEAEKRAREAFLERQKDGRYYDRAKHTEQVRATRQHRQELQKRGLLLPPEETS